MSTSPILLLLLCCSSLTAYNAEQVCAEDQRGTEPTAHVHGIEGAHFRFYSNLDINEENPDIKRLLIAIQGNKRDAVTRLRIMERVAMGDKETLIISPSFKTRDDILLQHEPFWKSAGWKQGDRSKDEARISSFAVLDDMVQRILTCGKFPSLKHVIVSGHSAGGQFTHRYAITSMLPDQFATIEFTFLVMNPSSYTYLNTERPSQFSVVQVPKFDDYKYGLSKRNAYSSWRTKGDLRTTYLQRRVIYALGQADNDPCAEDLDLTEAAMLQGANRLERGVNYFGHINSFIDHGHQILEIPGIGHDAEGMYASTAVRAIIFH